MSLDTVLSHNILPHAAIGGGAGTCALVLMGGGARTAYQAGVLKALAAMLPEQRTEFPFRWLESAPGEFAHTHGGESSLLH